MVSGYANRKDACALCKHWSAVGLTKYDPKSQRFEYDLGTRGYCAMKKKNESGGNCCRDFQKDFRFL